MTGEMKEPTLLPTTYPNILVSANTGIAVGMASNFCGFNLAEVCRTTIEHYQKSRARHPFPRCPAPDFTTGGELIYDGAKCARSTSTGRGSFKVRAKWAYNKKENLIEITEIPYTTTIEAIIDKIAGSWSRTARCARLPTCATRPTFPASRSPSTSSAAPTRKS